MSIYSNNHFSLKVNPGYQSTEMVMEVMGIHITTGNIKSTIPYLKRNLPSILFSKCFNEKNYTFAREVKNTEVGHLFEHILLEYLSIIKKANGIEDHIHNGVTSWNWVEDRRGVFHITIDVGECDQVYFMRALQKSIDLTVRILDHDSGNDYAANNFRMDSKGMYLGLNLESES